MSAHTVEIPCEKLPDGRLFMSDHDIQIAGPEAVAFIARCQGYWERDDRRSGWISGPWKTCDDQSSKAQTTGADKP